MDEENLKKLNKLIGNDICNIGDELGKLTIKIWKEAQKEELEKFEDYNHSQTVFDKKLDDFIVRQKELILE